MKTIFSHLELGELIKFSLQDENFPAETMFFSFFWEIATTLGHIHQL